jgi:ELWxxDGT repeat protein
VTDGTPEGTRLLADVNPGSGNGTAPDGAYSSPSQAGFVSLGSGRALFTATDPAHGYEPWVTDGTSEGTHLLTDLNLGPDSGIPSSNSASSSQFSFLPLGNGRVLFAATDGAHGYEPWITDGTAEGTRLVADINPGAASSNGFSFYAFGSGRALFAANDGSHGNELWVSDGTADGTSLVADINPGSEGSFAGLGGFAALDGQRVLFAATEGRGRNLWVTDGTAAGTHLAVELDPGASSSDPEDFFSLGDGRVLFSFASSSSGRELWVSDGTAEGTHQVADINPGSSSSFPGQFVVLAPGQALFTADNGVRGKELWITDGTAEGTRLLRDLNPGSQPSDPSGFALIKPICGTLPSLGDDLITGSDAPDIVLGDAAFLFNHVGGSDQLFGSAGNDILIGDALHMGGRAQGGDDVLSGDGGDDLLYGDAALMLDLAGGGQDHFLFSGLFGSDTVGDFRQGEDRLEFHVPGLNSIDDLQIAPAAFGTVITARQAGTVTLVGFKGALAEQDLLFI